jgi:hypothetical protein
LLTALERAMAAIRSVDVPRRPAVALEFAKYFGG